MAMFNSYVQITVVQSSIYSTKKNSQTDNQDFLSNYDIVWKIPAMERTQDCEQTCQNNKQSLTVVNPKRLDWFGH